MSSSETMDKYNKTATPLFYIGLMGLIANLAYFYTPIASIFILCVLLIQKYWKINNSFLKIVLVFALMPLLINLSALTFQQLLILLFSGVSSVGSDIYVKFSGSEVSYVIQGVLLFMMLLSITGILATLLLLNIIFPIYKKVIRIIITPLFLLPLLASFFLSLLGGLEAYVDLVNYLTGQFSSPLELIIDKKINDYHIRAYRTDYQGALGAFGVEVTQEKNLPFRLKLVREISNYYHCDNVQLNVLNDNTIWIKPDIDSHEINRELSLPKIFYLKPFYATKFLNYLNG